MKHIYQFIVLLFLVSVGRAQQLYPASLSTAGSSSSNAGTLLESSVGGLAVASVSSSTFLYTQGFLQPDAGTTTTLPPVNDVLLSSGSGLNNAGTTFINGNIMLEFTTGEAASITLSSTGNMVTQGILQPYPFGAVLPVTGLDLQARRTTAGTVALTWKTLQEFNNKGFYIERRPQHENSFISIGYVPTAAAGGNSTLPLFYRQDDDNNFTGKTYYRIRQVDTDGSIAYSPVRVVDGIAHSSIATIKAWPIPASAPVNVLVNGITRPALLLVYDISGRLVQQHTIYNGMTLPLKRLPPGTYGLRLAGVKGVVEKIVIR